MPIRQNILRKGKAPKQNLLQFDVLQEESGVLGDLTTSRFFKISEFPAVLPTGNSSFLIEGSNLLKPEVEIKIELLDADGNPIFHYAIPNYDKELPARRIAIEIYDDEVVNGIGSFTILGELNPREFDIPSDFQDTYNVRFTAPISINKKIKNTQPIRFYGDPQITVSEIVKGVIEKVPTGDSTQKTITGSVEFINTTPQTEFSVDVNSTTGNSNQLEEVGNSLASYVNQNQGSAQSSILPQTSIPKKPFTFVVKEMEKGVDNALNKITSAMKGATLSITRPDNLVDNTLYPDSKFDKPQSFETKILDVINSTTFTTTTQYTITNKSNNNKIIVPLNPSSSQASITHNVVSSTETEDTVFKRSFANMVVGNLRTFSGDTYKAKIYMKEDGTSGEFEKIYETLVESPNELVNKNSISGFENIGIFFTQSLIENNWVTSSNKSTATTNDDTIIDGVLLSGSNEAVGDTFTFVTKTNLELEKNEDYIVEFNAAFKKASKTQSDGTSKQQAELEVFITGSLESETDREISLGTIDLPDTTNTDFTIIQQKQITDFRTHNESSTPTGSLGFRVNSGQFILSDIRLRPFTQTNFSPGFFKSNVPMPKPIKRGKTYDFMVEFYDANNNLAETVALADNVSFDGPPQVIQGGDNILTGSMFLGSVVGSGIEAHGGSAFIKSVGYPGFESSSASGVGGFLMFSGSISESLGTSESYDGVGLELVSGSDRFLRFRTTPSIFEVVTDTFFLGSGSTASTGSFVSGSNGNIEISSSNFHLDVNGDVTLAGEITAEVGGTIGGFTINETDLTATNFVLDTSAKRLTIGTGNAIFVADADEGIFLGNANSGSAPFRVNREGDLVATSVTITGEVNATSGTAATSITALGFATASLTSSVDTLQDASSSLSLASGSFEVSASLAASSASAATASIAVNESASAAVTTDVADTRAQLVLDNTTANDQKINLVNTTGGIMSSFGKGAKFFGTASNALQTASANVNYSEVSADGFLVVTGSATASFFGNTTLIGHTGSQHISIAPNSLSVKTADDVTVLSASADGIDMSGSIKAGSGEIGGWTITEDTISDINPSGKGIEIKSHSSTPIITIKEDSNNKIEIFHTSANDYGIKGVSTGSTVFRLGNKNEIAGWKFTDEIFHKLSGSNTDVNAGIILDSAGNRIVVSGSTAASDNNSIQLKGNEGLIEVKQDNITIFNSGETALFTKNTTIEPAVFKPSFPIQDIVSSSADVTRPVPTMDNQKITSASQMNRLETKQFFQDTTAGGNTAQDALTPFFYMDRGLRMNTKKVHNDGTNGFNPTASFVVATTHDMTAQEFTASLFPPNFIFSSEYVTKPIETAGNFGFVSSSDSGSNIFTIMAKVSGSTHDDEDGDTDDFSDAKFNILGLEANTRGLPAARQNEYTFLQAKHSQSIRLQIQNDGDVVSKGNLTAFGTSFLSVSDEREKEHIYQISESLNKISDLRPTKFTWKETQKQDVGFIAQEVEKIIPEVVEETKGFINTDEDMNRKTISYPKLIPYLVDTIQELIQRIEKLEKKVK
jgi:hypothetical protein